MSYRGGYNRGGNFPPNYGRYQRPQPYPQPNGRNEIYEFNENQSMAHCSSNPPPRQNQNRKKNEENCNVVSRLKDISMLPYMERRNMKGIMTGNPRFHLVAFNGVPKYVKTSTFLADMALHIPEVKPRNIISIHANANDTTVDYLIGFNSIKIIKRFEELFGTGYIELYKSSVQFVMPDLQSNSCCEYNKVASDDLTGQKQPYTLTFLEPMSLIKVVEYLEKICGDKFHFVTAVCCVNEVTYININHSALVLMLKDATAEYKFQIEQSKTIALTGLIPSELLPVAVETVETPLNNNSTARLSSEEIVKFCGFKAIFEKFSKDQKDQEINMIKRSLRETQSTILTSVNDIELKLLEKLTPIEAKLSVEHSRFQERFDKIEKNQKAIMDMQKKILDIMKPKATAAPKKLKEPQALAPVNPPTSGRTGDGQFTLTQLEDEIDATRGD